MQKQANVNKTRCQKNESEGFSWGSLGHPGAKDNLTSKDNLQVKKQKEEQPECNLSGDNLS